MRPHVTVHAMLSIDGRLDHFAGDIGLYYELVSAIPHDAVLTGSATILAAAEREGNEMAGEDPLPIEGAVTASTAAPDAPLLVIVDSRGRLTRFDWLLGVPFWRRILVASAASTPDSHLALLDRRGIPHLTTGTKRVDLAGLLDVLAADHDIGRVRVDSGGELNGALLRAGLVDEISLVLAPYAVGGRTAAGLFVADDLVGDDVVRLDAIGMEPLRDGAVWLRYRVVPAGSQAIASAAPAVQRRSGIGASRYSR